jgi:hypothetical protein
MRPQRPLGHRNNVQRHRFFRFVHAANSGVFQEDVLHNLQPLCHGAAGILPMGESGNSFGMCTDQLRDPCPHPWMELIDL